MYVYLWVSLSYELRLLVEYCCSKPLCRVISILLSRPPVHEPRVAFRLLYFFFFSVFFILLFILYLLGTPRAKRYDRLYVSSTRYAALSFTFWIVRWPWYVFIFTVLLGKASICLKKVRRLRWDWVTRANTRIRMTLKRTRFNESSKSSIEKPAYDNLKERTRWISVG